MRDIQTQDNVVSSISDLFSDVVIVDRRSNSSHGYRAVHVIIKFESKLVEVQVRTDLQHLWAEWSEKLADQIDSGLKYGKGDQSFLEALRLGSFLVEQHEDLEREYTKSQVLFIRLSEQAKLNPDLKQAVHKYQEEVANAEAKKEFLKQEVFKVLQNAISTFPRKGS